MQDQMDELRQHTRAERRQRAKAAFTVSEGIAREREDIVAKLDHLRTVNKDIMDLKAI